MAAIGLDGDGTGVANLFEPVGFGRFYCFYDCAGVVVIDNLSFAFTGDFEGVAGDVTDGHWESRFVRPLFEDWDPVDVVTRVITLAFDGSKV